MKVAKFQPNMVKMRFVVAVCCAAGTVRPLGLQSPRNVAGTFMAQISDWERAGSGRRSPVIPAEERPQ